MPLTQDAVNDGIESVTLSLVHERPQVVVVGSATLTILDDERAPGVLGFELAAYANNEEAGSLTVNVRLRAGSRAR